MNNKGPFYLIGGIVALLVIMIFFTTFVKYVKVPAGYRGVKVYLLGTSKGVEAEPLGIGRYFLTLNEEMYKFPTFTQNYNWTKDPYEGSPNDESISFQTKEGLSVNADVGISYAVNPDKVVDIFQKYRKGIDEITDIYLHNMTRDAFVLVASNKAIESVYGEGKAELLREVNALVKAQVEPIGINVEKIYLIGDLRLPESVVQSIEAKISATQKAQQRQNEVAEAKAAADKAIANARGESESTLLTAKAEAQALAMKAEILNRNPSLIKYEAIKKWDGIMPKFTGGGAIPFINVDEK